MDRLRERLKDPAFRKEARGAIIAFFVTSFFLGGSFLCIFLALVANQSGEFRIAEGLFIASLLLALGGGIYAVPRLAKRIRMEFLNFRISYSFTQETAFFLVITIIVALAAFNTGNNLLYLVFAVLLSVIIASGVVSEGILRGIDVGLRFPEHVYAGQEVRLDVMLTNYKRLLPSLSLTVTVELDDTADRTTVGARLRNFLRRKKVKHELENLAHFTVIPARQRIRHTVPYTFRKRGKYHIVGFSVSTKFPFGFLQKTRQVEAEGTVTVYPEIDGRRDALRGLADMAGTLENLLKGNGADLYAIRQYQSGDQMRRIDWKATAKTRRMMVRETAREDERRVTMTFDHRAPRALDDADRETFEIGVKRAATIISQLVKANALVRLVTPSQSTEFGNTQRHLHDMMRLLAEVQCVSKGEGEAAGEAAKPLNGPRPSSFAESGIRFEWANASEGRVRRTDETVLTFEQLREVEKTPEEKPS